MSGDTRAASRVAALPITRDRRLVWHDRTGWRQLALVPRLVPPQGTPYHIPRVWGGWALRDAVFWRPAPGRVHFDGGWLSPYWMVPWTSLIALAVRIDWAEVWELP